MGTIWIFVDSCIRLITVNAEGEVVRTTQTGELSRQLQEDAKIFAKVLCL